MHMKYMYIYIGHYNAYSYDAAGKAFVNINFDLYCLHWNSSLSTAPKSAELYYRLAWNRHTKHIQSLSPADYRQFDLASVFLQEIIHKLIGSL